MSERENVYGFLWWMRGAVYKKKMSARQVFDFLVEQNVHGVYVIEDHDFDARTRSLAILCKKAGIDFILGFPHIPENTEARQHMEQARSPLFSHSALNVKEAMKITNKLALGNGESGEWYGDALAAQAYVEEAKELGYEWVCSLSIHSILRDLYTCDLRHILQDTQCMTLCGHILIGYLLKNKTIPNWRKWCKKWKKEFQYLDTARLARWVKDINIWTGVGFQKGLDAGMRGYAEIFNFDGVIVGIPFDLEGKK